MELPSCAKVAWPLRLERLPARVGSAAHKREDEDSYGENSSIMTMEMVMIACCGNNEDGGGDDNDGDGRTYGDGDGPGGKDARVHLVMLTCHANKPLVMRTVMLRSHCLSC
eukprot:16441770-Heterocapsa_arctica.AAC.1